MRRRLRIGVWIIVVTLFLATLFLCLLAGATLFELVALEAPEELFVVVGTLNCRRLLSFLTRPRTRPKRLPNQHSSSDEQQK